MKPSASNSTLTRIVKMTFVPGTEQIFLGVFQESAKQIRAFSGCEYLALKKDMDKEGVYFTHSRWKNAETLQQYRQSELFRQTWAKTKVLFAAKAEAWSLKTEAEFA
ncbi:MAG TPA: antibiotic biosynthesis monooxygenase family protein [Bacteroidia bacterium]|jgi:autoinducer 2-degrading protein|nr:antibiotic biosynthesis monooxygenase family protein [Bacteroidia bacterium]